jgi:hypothetical protein
MLQTISERKMHYIRWSLTIGWLLLIVSLFYDPITIVLTDPNTLWSPLRLNPSNILDPVKCVKLRESCISQKPYPIGAVVWWGAVVPSAIFIVLVLGHEFWRRICPLSFLSQLPRALGIQRKQRIVDPNTGAERRELVKIGENSWLGKNHLYVQFGLFIGGLGLRILLVNCNRIALGIFLLLTIASAITVGYLYAGKSWCHYFCPMAPVQLVYTGPRSLFGSESYVSKNPAGITQSMCRTIDATTGQEQSACVGCKATCFDIDAEKNYWQDVEKPGRQFVHYGYFGMVVAFYLYFYLYSGNWNYFFSGVWTHEDQINETPWDELWEAGFYLYGQTLPIPKLFAVFITFAVLTSMTYGLGLIVEKLCRKYVTFQHRAISGQRARHIVFTLFTIAAFWTFFSYGARPLLNRLPTPLLLGFNALIVLVGSMWLFRTIQRQKQDYDRSTMTTSLRKQLQRLDIWDPKLLEGRSIDELNPDELHMLVNVLPGFSEQLRRQTYKGVLQDCLEQKTVNLRTSFEFCEKLRRELQLEDSVHFDMLAEIISNHDQFFNPHQAPPSAQSVQSAVTIARTIVKRIRPLNSPVSKSIDLDSLQPIADHPPNQATTAKPIVPTINTDSMPPIAPPPASNRESA